MLWKLLLSSLLMFVSIHEAIGQLPLPPPEDDGPMLTDGPGPVCSVDVVFLVDESWSISDSWFDRAKQFIIDFFNCFTHLHDIWVGVIPYNCVPRTYRSLAVPFAPSIHYLMREGGLTRTGLAIRYMKSTSNFRAGVPRAAVVMTDGWSKDNFAAAAAAAMAAGIKMYAVSLGEPALVDNAALVTIAGSPDRVFNTDIPCKVAFRILADLCKLSGVPGCLSYEGDTIMPLGSSYQPETWGCVTCGCSDHGEMLCSGVGCALRYPPCVNEVNVAGGCCPVCEDDGGVPDGCLYKDNDKEVLIPVGTEYKPDDCTVCTCPAAGAEPECEPILCIALYCPNPVHIVGQCCPICPGCLQGDVLIPVGATYQPDPCTFCSCPYAGAAPMCAVIDCAVPPCSNYVTPPGQCCPVCIDIGCEHDDGLILPDKPYQESPCVTCYCPAPGAEPLCAAIACMPLPCAGSYISIAGQCCPGCDSDAPDGCWYKEDNNMILVPVGVDYQPNPCTIVSCFAAGEPAAIAIIDCAIPSCPDPKYIAGECCPVCL